MRLYFIRHGESESNFNNIITGQQDIPLTDKGRTQAHLAGQHIREQAISFDRIISSSLVRAHDTARLIAHEIGFPEDTIEINDLVIERSFGTLEGKAKEEASSDAIIEAAGGESDEHVRIRAQLFLESLQGTEGAVLVVSHTGFGRRLRAVAEDIPTGDSKNFENAELADLGEL